MKFLTQVLLPILLIIGLIGGVTFVSQYSGTIKPAKRTAATVTPAAFDFHPPLKNGEAVALWDGSDGRPDFEVYTEHSYDFSLHNRGETALTVGLRNVKRCTCAKVHLTPLGPEEVEYVAKQGPAWAKTLGNLDRWQELDYEGTKTVTVPPGGWALVRLSWTGRETGDRKFLAPLWIDRGLLGREEPLLVVPARIVRPIQVDPQSAVVTAADLTTREPERQVEFKCWSSTRSGFPLIVREETRSPNFVCEAKPLDAKECAELAKIVKSRVQSGYLVTVRVRERQGKHQLDLGPFQRRILLTAGPAEAESVAVMLQGMVRGEVAFLNPEEKDRINLENFSAAQGTSKTVVLMTEQENQQLETDSWAPELLAVKLAKVGGRRWELSVEVPANRQKGRLPEHSAVILKTGVRRIRIPVAGMATQ